MKLPSLIDPEPLNENTIKFKSLMRQSETLPEIDAPVVEALVKFTQTKSRYLPVVKNNNLVGISGYSGYMDILHKVLRA
ncbi:MAG: hypothetical protein LBV52_04970 [Spirochaetaceae bacterium]|jgi:CBS domain-containing protein|nr:hypothetical protein [Spirochaetaceae bacterium]